MQLRSLYRKVLDTSGKTPQNGVLGFWKIEGFHELRTYLEERQLELLGGKPEELAVRALRSSLGESTAIPTSDPIGIPEINPFEEPLTPSKVVRFTTRTRSNRS